MRNAFGGNLITNYSMKAAIVLFGTVLILISWLFLFFKIQDERQTEINHAVRDLTNFARAFHEHSLRTLKSADQVALFIKYHCERDGRAIDMSPYIFVAKLATEPYVLISIADQNGDLVTSNQEPFVPSNIKDREHFRVHMAEDTGKAFVSKPVLGRSSGKWSIQISRRINRPDDSFGGVVVVSLDPFYFSDFYNQVNLGRDSVIGLVGRDNIIRAWQYNQQPSIGQDLQCTNNQLITEIAAKGSGHCSLTSPVDGIKRFYSYQLLPDYQLAVVVGRSESEMLAKFYQRQRIYYLAVILLNFLIIGFCATLIQIKRLEQKFVRLEQLNLIGKMAAGLGHEIRNPITAVRGFLQMLGSKPRYNRDKEYFKLMIEELDRANSTITEYLSLSKDKPVEKASANLNEIIKKLFPLIKADSKAQKKDAEINIQEIPDLMLDEKQIRQLILNLVRNGLEAMSPGGKVTIRTFPDNSDVIMAIQDEGKGIDPRLLDKLGTPFFTTKDNGTGLGLAICYSIAARHNADIKLKTTPAGTTFFIRFKGVKK